MNYDIKHDERAPPLASHISLLTDLGPSPLPFHVTRRQLCFPSFLLSFLIKLRWIQLCLLIYKTQGMLRSIGNTIDSFCL
ncbi:hypothetical protein L1887_14679 [Cichorium endivia]|nr:hypothetical protein L1887_14679 [Cichorium endivia]